MQRHRRASSASSGSSISRSPEPYNHLARSRSSSRTGYNSARTKRMSVSSASGVNISPGLPPTLSSSPGGGLAGPIPSFESLSNVQQWAARVPR